MDHKTKTLAGGVLVFGLGMATGIFAQNAMEYDSPQRKEQKRADLSGAPNMEVIASLAEYHKGEAIRLHHHHGIEAVYIVQGTTVQMPGKDPMELKSGTAGMNLRDVKHAGYTVVGDAPLKLFTVHIVDKGKPLYDWDK